MVESPNLKRSSHAQCFGILKQTHIFTRKIVCALFHDAKFGHTFININKQLNWNILIFNYLHFTTPKKYDHTIFKCTVLDK